MKKYILILLTVCALPSYGFDTRKYAYKATGETVTALGAIVCAATYFFTSTRSGLSCTRKLLKKRNVIVKKDAPIFTTDLKGLMYGLGVAVFALGIYLKA